MGQVRMRERVRASNSWPNLPPFAPTTMRAKQAATFPTSRQSRRRILNHANICIAAFALFIPNGRYINEPRAFRNITIEAARKISSLLGWEPGEAATIGVSRPRPGRLPVFRMAYSR